MVKDLEILMFIKELGRLLEDYKKCTDETVKAMIQDDIMFLTKIINPY
jgi:hypothetical protein